LHTEDEIYITPYSYQRLTYVIEIYERNVFQTPIVTMVVGVPMTY